MPEEKVEQQGQETVTVDKAVYATLLAMQADLRKRVVADTVKTLGNNKAVWRQRMVMRRVDPMTLVPDEDLVAYDCIHKLKNPTGDSKQKITVTDNEIKAYKVLDPDFSRTVNLAEVLEQVTRMKATGVLTEAGDNAGGSEDLVEEEGI